MPIRIHLCAAEWNGASTLLRAIADGLGDISGEIEWRQRRVTPELKEVEG